MHDACYVYCISCGELAELNLTGINGEKVSAIEIDKIRVLVHKCSQEPYQGEDEEVKKWIMQHNQVVEQVWLEQGTVIPMSFDVIIKGKGELSASENICNWIAENKEIIKKELEKLKGKAEYTVKIIINNKFNLVNNKTPVVEKNEKLKGFSYLQAKRTRRNAREVSNKRLAKLEEDYKKRIAAVVSGFVENRTKKISSEEREIMNLSLLADESEANKLGLLLDEINGLDNLRIRYTGPWPPYSFSTEFSSLNQE